MPHRRKGNGPRWLRNKYRTYKERNRILRKMGFRSYYEYLRSDLWLGIRYEHLLHNPNCQVCNIPATDVHHIRYDEATLRKYDPRSLASLCGHHHKYIEIGSTGSKRSLREANKTLQEITPPKPKKSRRRRPMKRTYKIPENLPKKNYIKDRVEQEK